MIIKIFRYLNRLGIVQSLSATRKNVDKLCEESDAEILRWKEELEQVSFQLLCFNAPVFFKIEIQ